MCTAAFPFPDSTFRNAQLLSLTSCTSQPTRLEEACSYLRSYTFPWGQRLDVYGHHFHRPQGSILLFPVCELCSRNSYCYLSPCVL